MSAPSSASTTWRSGCCATCAPWTRRTASGPRASALSVLVFRGPQSLGALAQAEGVKPPTMSRLVKAMQAEGLVATHPVEGDQRGIRIEATPRGRKLMLAGRERRLAAIRKMLESANATEMRALETVTGLLERALDPPKLSAHRRRE